MAERIAGVNIREQSHTRIALQDIYGIGLSRAMKICEASNVDPHQKIADLTPEELDILRKQVAKFTVEGNLRREVSMHIKREMDIGSYRGRRHRNRLPVRGQRTKTNARTRKGRRGKVVK